MFRALFLFLLAFFSAVFSDRHRDPEFLACLLRRGRTCCVPSRREQGPRKPPASPCQGLWSRGGQILRPGLARSSQRVDFGSRRYERWIWKILFPLLQESHNRDWLVKKTKLIDPLVHVMCKNVFTTEIAPRESARAHRGRKEETGASTESASTMATLCRSRVAVSTVAATRAQLGPGLLARILSHGGNRGGGSQGAARRGREIHGRISSFWDGRPQRGFPFFSLFLFRFFVYFTPLSGKNHPAVCSG